MKGLFILFVIVIFIQAIMGLTIYHQMPTWTDRGTFGDMFGAINTLFSGLAFAGVIYAVFLQSKELKLQREELELTRNELEKSTKAQASQANTMLKAAKINALSARIQSYSQLLSARRKLPGSNDSSTFYALTKVYQELETLMKEA